VALGGEGVGAGCGGNGAAGGGMGGTGEEGAAAADGAFRSLRFLGLRDNGLGCEHAGCLLALVRQVAGARAPLQHLDLGGNALDEVSAAWLLHPLASCGQAGAAWGPGDAGQARGEDAQAPAGGAGGEAAAQGGQAPPPVLRDLDLSGLGSLWRGGGSDHLPVAQLLPIVATHPIKRLSLAGWRHQPGGLGALCHALARAGSLEELHVEAEAAHESPDWLALAGLLAPCAPGEEADADKVDRSDASARQSEGRGAAQGDEPARAPDAVLSLSTLRIASHSAPGKRNRLNRHSHSSPTPSLATATGHLASFMRALARSLSAPTCRLRHLDLSSCWLGCKGISLLAQALASAPGARPTIQRLGVAQNGLGAAGAVALAHSVRVLQVCARGRERHPRALVCCYQPLDVLRQPLGVLPRVYTGAGLIDPPLQGPARLPGFRAEFGSTVQTLLPMAGADADGCRT